MKTIKLIIRMILGAAFIAAPTCLLAAPIQITALPYYITAPGTYVLSKDLTCPPTSNIAAIVINYQGIPPVTGYGTISGPVTVDLQGHTITGSPPNGTQSTGIYITQSSATAPNIVVQNGTIKNCMNGVVASAPYRFHVSNVFLNKLNISGALSALNGQPGRCIQLVFIQSSIVSNCQFSNSDEGIFTIDCGFSNSLINNSFTQSVGIPLDITEQEGVMREGICTWTAN